MYKCYPVDYISITQGYSNAHKAIDCGWWGDTSDRPIYSVANGKVLEVRNNYETQDKTGNSYGNYILIENEDGSRSTYCHLKYASCLVKVGEAVKQHQHIATMGNTGYSFGPHLHYEHRINGEKVNPFDYLYCYPDFQEINYDKPDAKYVKTKPEEPQKSIDEIAREVINGDWGNQPERQQRLEEAGYNYEEVQNRVNEILAEEKSKKTLEVGTRVRTTGTGNSQASGNGRSAKSNMIGVISRIISGANYPYCVDDNEGPLGWYKAEDLEIL